MVRYFFGDDTYQAREAIEDVVKRRAGRLIWLDREDIERQPLRERLEQGSGGLFGKEVLVARDVSLWPKAMQQEVVEATKMETGADLIVWDRVQSDRRSALFRALKKKQAQEFSYPDVVWLVRWLVAEAGRRGGAIDTPAARLLIERIGFDRWRLGSELEKLMLRGSGEVGQRAVEEAVEVAGGQQGIFIMLDALIGGKQKQAIRVMEELLEAGESELYVLSMLAYQYRSLLLIATCLRRGLTPEEIAAKTGLHPYVVRKHQSVARQVASEQLLDALTKILAADVAIKQGRVDSRTGLTMLVLGLAHT